METVTSLYSSLEGTGTERERERDRQTVKVRYSEPARLPFISVKTNVLGKLSGRVEIVYFDSFCTP